MLRGDGAILIQTLHKGSVLEITGPDGAVVRILILDSTGRIKVGVAAPSVYEIRRLAHCDIAKE